MDNCVESRGKDQVFTVLDALWNIGERKSETRISTRRQLPRIMVTIATDLCCLAYASHLLRSSVHWILSYFERNRKCVSFLLVLLSSLPKFITNMLIILANCWCYSIRQHWYQNYPILFLSEMKLISWWYTPAWSQSPYHQDHWCNWNRSLPSRQQNKLDRFWVQVMCTDNSSRFSLELFSYPISCYERSRA